MLYQAKKYLRNQYTEWKLADVMRHKHFLPEQAILVFSDPRGGSTWLTQLINEIPCTAVVWEPLHLNEGSSFKELSFGWRQHIPIEADWPEARNAFEELLSGKRLNAYATYLSSPDKYKRASQLIVKFCRGTALLPWLVNQFDFNYAPIYLVRHPFAVVASQIRHGGWNQQVSTYEIPSAPFNDIYVQHADFLISLKTREEQLVATWCITNKVALEDENNNQKWITLHYENLLLNPQVELEKVFSQWGMEIPSKMIEKVNDPSKTTVETSPVKKNINQISKWKQQFSEETIRKLEDVLHYFQINQYSSENLPTSHLR